ncbi:MAG TPA: response regulator transcription factor [Mycobacteriales bacterium]
MTTVLVCDDQRLVRDELRARLGSIPGVERVLTAASGEELLSRFPYENPDLVLLDSQMPGLSGVETARRLLRLKPEAHILMLIGRQDREQATAAVSAGVRGWLAKDGTHASFITGVAGALAGSDLGMPPRRVPVSAPRGGDDVALTERELQVLEGMTAGRSNAEIGRSLYLSEDTVKTHARRLFRKLGVNDRAQAVALGFRRGLVH